MRPATIRDVAREAGVSRSTVYRALNGAGPVSPGAHAVVADAARRLAYRPHATARSLATGHGTRLSVAVVGPTEAVLVDPYVTRVVTAVGELAEREQVGVTVRWLRPDGSTDLDDVARDRSLIGAIVLNHSVEVLASVPAGLRHRIVTIGRNGLGRPAFDVDSVHAVRLRFWHLYAQGRRRIAYISGPEWLTCAWDPTLAYQELCVDAGTPVRVAPGDYVAECGARAAREILHRWPDTDAIMTINDAAAVGAVHTLLDAGLTVPSDVAVAGFDDMQIAHLVRPGLTTVSHPVEQIAAAAAAALLTDPAAPGELTTFTPHLVPRASTEGLSVEPAVRDHPVRTPVRRVPTPRSAPSGATPDRAETRAAQIRRHAITLFAERGFWRSTVRDLADTCGLTVPGVLHHIGSKEALLLSTIAVPARREADVLDRVRRDSPSPSVAAARRLCGALVSLDAEDPLAAQLRTVIEVEALNPDHPAHAAMAARRAAVTHALISALPAEADPLGTASALLAARDGVVLQWLRSGDPDLRSAWDRVADRLLPASP